MERRTFLKLAAGGVAAAAVGGGLAWSRHRRAVALRSEPITGPWPALGEGVQWVLPELRHALVVVPDRPHSRQDVLDPARRALITRVRSFRVDSGPRRLRGASFADQPASGIQRLLAIGDSVTFGWGVEGDQTWPARLQARLAAAGRAVEVLNAGVPAQTLEGMEAYLQAEAPTLGLTGVLFTRRPPRGGRDAVYAYAQTIARVRRALPGARVHVFLPPISRFDPRGCTEGSQEARLLGAALGDVPLLDLTDSLRAAQGSRGSGLEVVDGRQRLVDLARGEVLLEALAPPEGLAPQIYVRFEEDPAVREALFFDDGHPDAEGLDVVAGAVVGALEAAAWWG
ncbi:MAG: SGNH/GDSL hydrolase family protein [Pseudomonadota bacterium]